VVTSARMSGQRRTQGGRRTGQAKKDAADVARRLLRSVRTRARAQGIACTITEADITVPTHCPVLRIPLNKTSRDNWPSVDRIVPRRGYVRGNVAVISMRANRLKSNMTLDELFGLLDYMTS
jgi:hypothetical protein